MRGCPPKTSFLFCDRVLISPFARLSQFFVYLVGLNSFCSPDQSSFLSIQSGSTQYSRQTKPAFRPFSRAYLIMFARLTSEFLSSSLVLTLQLNRLFLKISFLVGKLVSLFCILELNKIAARWPAKAVA